MFEQLISVTRGRKEGVLRRRDDDFTKSNIKQISYRRYSKSKSFAFELEVESKFS